MAKTPTRKAAKKVGSGKKTTVISLASVHASIDRAIARILKHEPTPKQKLQVVRLRVLQHKFCGKNMLIEF